MKHNRYMRHNKRQLRKYIPALASLCMILMIGAALCACADGGSAGDVSSQEPVSRDFFAMDTYISGERDQRP